MRFEIKIELGNDAMQTWGDLSEALLRVSSALHEFADSPVVTEPQGGKLCDDNGNVVGEWKVVP